ncbi:MAG: hypothetical protein JWP01_2387 [Myxococcales bacterium]|jgi:hypothetical protein|nr:hypothetical protein [Myxococcales bacterium]
MQLVRHVTLVLAFVHGACDDDIGLIGGLVPADGPEGDTTISVTLSPGTEVPVCAAAGTFAMGAATLRIASDDSALTVDELTYASLSGTPTTANIHAGAPGIAGPDVFPIVLPATLRQVFTDDSYPSPAPSGAPADFDAFIQSVRDGNAYVSVNTASCPSGEIRGQL